MVTRMTYGLRAHSKSAQLHWPSAVAAGAPVSARGRSTIASATSPPRRAGNETERRERGYSSEREHGRVAEPLRDEPEPERADREAGVEPRVEETGELGAELRARALERRRVERRIEQPMRDPEEDARRDEAE